MFALGGRFPEDTKTSIDDPTGDDNPDINDYIGRVELGYAFQVNNIEIFTRIRNNLSGSQNRGQCTSEPHLPTVPTL